MVQIIRKALLPNPSEVIERLRPAASQAHCIVVREPRPAGFPLLFTANMLLIEPAVAFLHEHFVQRGHTADTLRTYCEILYDWFETLEQNAVDWDSADAVDLVAYRNRMLLQPSARTGRPYRLSTVNLRVRGVLRFYEWAVRMRWLEASSLVGKPGNFGVARRPQPVCANAVDHSLFVLRQFELLPRPLTSGQARELLATLPPPYDLMARWQIYTGLRVSELLRLSCKDVSGQQPSAASHHTIEVTRKGRPCGHAALFINARGAPAGKNAYQRVISQAGQACGFRATTHLMRATFACMLLARLERLASQGVAINPLLVVKVLMGHQHIETTDRYLRAIAVDACALKEVLDTLLSGTP